MLRIVIEDDRLSDVRTQLAGVSAAAASPGGSAPPHLVNSAKHPLTKTASQTAARDAGKPPAWLADVVKGLVSQAAANAARPSA